MTNDFVSNYIQATLNSEESIEFLVAKKRYLPLRREDFIRIPMLAFFSFLAYLMAKNIFLNGFSKGFTAYFSFILLIYVYLLFIVIKNYCKRYLVAFKWKYIVTNKRLLILNHKNSIENSFYYDNFPQIEFTENLSGNGFITIGEKEPFLSESSSLISYRVGVNFSEEDIVLYNIKNVKNVCNLIKSRITNYAVE
ncbi:hypothetical protein J2Y38_001536 [Flavobacterium sp. 2755]|uniref:hypothetical protein n=1 Tax=Flavobacterium sp. 2755 TaxID=2817765 RepID=UPI0028638D04|nr:hypothetical protein [Flavobacterium sp. 2755]MDR6761327.1 hypothetical protein [Flavobacterium sp. 2755]